MALPVAGCDLREGAQERLGGQCGGNNRLRGQLGRTLGNHWDGYRRVRSQSVLADLPAQLEGARPREVKLVISDAHSGLKAAIQQVFVQTDEKSAHAT